MTELLRETLIAPSILSADFGRLEEDVAKVVHACARLVQLDRQARHFRANLPNRPAAPAARPPPAPDTWSRTTGPPGGGPTR